MSLQVRAAETGRDYRLRCAYEAARGKSGVTRDGHLVNVIRRDEVNFTAFLRAAPNGRPRFVRCRLVMLGSHPAGRTRNIADPRRSEGLVS
jgi:hypothetical protein